MDWARVHEAMLDLEDQTNDPDPDVPVGVVIAKLLGVEHDAAADAFLASEIRRVVELMGGHYARMGVRPTPANMAALGMLQGITLAEAVRRVGGWP